MNKIINGCYKKSLELLTRNATPCGIVAAAPSKKSGDKNYNKLFGRDTSISALGLIATKNKEYLKLAKISLISLSRAQSPKGQIPFSMKTDGKEINYWMPGNLDSTLWWLIASLIYLRETKDYHFKKILQSKIKKSFTWLSYQDQNEDSLLEEGEASGWADEMPNRGVTLYTNILWFKAISLYVKIFPFHNPFDQKTISLIKDGLNALLWQPNKIKTGVYLKENPFIKNFIVSASNLKKCYRPYFLNYFTHRYFGPRFDLYGNILAIIFNLASQKQRGDIIHYALKKRLNRPYPIIAYYPPIKKNDREWVDYMSYRYQNLPGQYHNGGIWPYVGGFWVITLKIAGYRKLAETELENLARANQINNWEFNEHLHGRTGKPLGVKKQSWNAATFILAYQSLKNNLVLL